MNEHDKSPGAGCDLHVHSRYSDRPSEWFLRRIGAPESFVAPQALYATCRARGMDYVTITDHNDIRGALEIADQPGTFVSSELTTYFPDDGCKVHCLVWGITEADFQVLQAARPSIFDLRAALIERRIAHAIAHPLFRVNDRLTPDHVEQLLVLFDRFETLNGSREPAAGNLFAALARELTPAWLAAAAERHGLTPAAPLNPHKVFTGGSDDHSGLYSAEAHTRTPPAATVFDFLEHLREGRHEPAGRAGSSVRLAHSLYHIAGSYYRERLGGRASGGGLLGALFERLLAHEVPVATRRRVWIPAALTRWAGRRRMRGMGEIERLLLAEFQARRLNMPAAPRAGASRFPELARLGHALSYACLCRFSEQLERGRLIESLQALSALGPILLGMAPYLTACAAQHKDRDFLTAVAARHPAGAGKASATGRRAWLTDTLTDVNGVAHTIKTLASLARSQDREITVLTSLDEPPDAASFNLCNFPPVGRFHLPEYPQQEAVFPPVLDLVAQLEEGGYEQLIISTPGPVGLVGLLAANLLKLPVVGIYHTDFPRYVGLLTEDTLLEDLTWRYMQWFYGRCDRILTPSETYRASLQDRGFAPEKLGILSRGVDRTRFRPDLRRPDFWQPYGLNGGLKFLYVGRISKEKNLELLCEAFRRLQTRQFETALALVGSGPQLNDLSRRYAGNEIAFTGRLEGETLAQAYASADVFVFPSLTDTFGNVVLEAHASGLPAIVAEHGAPAEIVASHHTGLTTDMRDPEQLAAAMQQLADDHHLRQELRQRALVRAAASTWEQALEQLWVGS